MSVVPGRMVHDLCGCVEGLGAERRDEETLTPDVDLLQALNVVCVATKHDAHTELITLCRCELAPIEDGQSPQLVRACQVGEAADF